MIRFNFRRWGRIFLLVVLFSALPVWGRLAEAAIAFVNSADDADDTLHTTLTTAATNHTSGNFLAVLVKYETSATTITVSDTAGNTFTPLTHQSHSGSNGHIQIFYAKNITGHANNVVTVTFGASVQYSRVVVQQYSGIDTSSPFDQQSTLAEGASTTPTSNSVTTVQPDELLVAMAGELSAAGAYTAGTNWTLRKDFTQAPYNLGGTATEDRIVSSTGTYSATFTNASSHSWFIVMAAFKGILSGVEQEGFRFRNDNGNETTATWLAAQDTSITQPTSTNTRLRMLVATSVDPASKQYQLEYKLSSDSSYRKVEAASGSVAYGSDAGAEGTTTVTVPYPTGVTAGDLLILAIANKYPNNGPSTPAGWTLPSNCQGSGGSGSSGNDTGSVYSTIFVKEATITEVGSEVVTISSGNSAEASMLRYTKGTGKSWSYACTNGSDNSAGTSWSVTGAADPGIASGDMVVVASAMNTDAYTYSSQAISATGVTFGAATEEHNAGTTLGQDCWLVVSDHAVSSGTSSAAPVFTMTSSGTAANRPAGASSILRIRQVDQPIQLSASANISASGDNTTAQLTAPAGKTTADFVTGRMQDDENPADAVDITNNDYTELEWSMIATSSASNGQVYQFRVTGAGNVFETYTVTPQWTIGTPVSYSPKISSAFITFD